MDGAGNVHMFACGPGCDAGGFVLDEALVVHRFDATAEPFVCGRVLPEAWRGYAMYGVVRQIDRQGLAAYGPRLCRGVCRSAEDTRGDAESVVDPDPIGRD